MQNELFPSVIAASARCIRQRAAGVCYMRSEQNGSTTDQKERKDSFEEEVPLFSSSRPMSLLLCLNVSFSFQEEQVKLKGS